MKFLKKKIKFNNLFHAHICDCKTKSFQSAIKKSQTLTEILILFVTEFVVLFSINNDLSFSKLLFCHDMNHDNFVKIYRSSDKY